MKEVPSNLQAMFDVLDSSIKEQRRKFPNFLHQPKGFRLGLQSQPLSNIRLPERLGKIEKRDIEWIMSHHKKPLALSAMYGLLLAVPIVFYIFKKD